MSSQEENGHPDGGSIAATKVTSKFQGITLSLEIKREEINNSVRDRAIKSEEVIICINGMDTTWLVEVFPKGTDLNITEHEGDEGRDCFSVYMSLVSSSSYEDCVLGHMEVKVKNMRLLPYSTHRNLYDIRRVCEKNELLTKYSVSDKEGYYWIQDQIDINNDEFYIDGKMELTIVFCVKADGGKIEKFTEDMKVGEKKFASDMRSIVTMDHLEDVALVCGDEKMFCHSNVLSARSGGEI